jgi:hypothetical protein
LTSPAVREDRAPIATSLILLLVAVVGHGAFAVHTILSRRRYARFFDDNLYDAPLPARLLVQTPAPIYAAAFVLLALVLLMKEVAVERKEVALRLNLAALVLLGLLWMAWTVSVSGPCDALDRGGP